jgi:hypothetical protein
VAYNQLKVGPELISNSREAWLGYYVFTGLALAMLGGGYLLVRQSGVQGADYWLLLVGVFLLSLVAGGIAVMCHLLGHVIDMIDEMRRDQSAAKSSQP